MPQKAAGSALINVLIRRAGETTVSGRGISPANGPQINIKHELCGGGDDRFEVYAPQEEGFNLLLSSLECQSGSQ